MPAHLPKSERYDTHATPDRRHSDGWVDERDSFYTIYLSLVPFLLLEYLAEASFSRVPSGVIFPFGFLLFWAFYYTYYRPGFLEDRLSNTDEWNFESIPIVLLGVVVWFVKVTVVGLIRFILAQFDIHPPKKKLRPLHQAPKYQPAPSAKPKRRKTPRPLPPDIQKALNQLGIGRQRRWEVIHQRYRDLAKQFHPDLNPNITDVGHRFMRYDAAYKKLYAVRKTYFN